MTSPEGQPARDDPKPAKPAGRSRARKWVARIGFGILFFVVLVVVGVQIVLWTGIPESIVISQVEKGMGLRMGVNTLSTGWLGHTSMSGVKIALPLSQQAFLEVPEMKVDHTGLIPLIFGADVEITGVELDKPLLHVRQNAAGKWNLEEVAELLARAGGKKTGEQTAQSTAPTLPRLVVSEMSIIVIDNENHQTRIEPINVSGAPETPVSWKYDMEIPSRQQNVQSHLSLLGRVVPGTWQHEAEIQVHDISAWIKPWLPTFNLPVSLSAKWSGQPQPDGLSGFLQIKDLTIGNYHADGALAATESGNVFSVSPENLHLSESDPTQPDSAPRALNVTIPQGTLDYDGKVVRATQMQLSLLGGPATFNGWFEPGINQGAVEGYWQNLSLPIAGTTQSGKLNLTYSRPVAAPLRIALSATTSGTLGKNPFDAVLKLTVTGDDFNNLNWELATPELAYHRGPQPIFLSGLTAAGSYAYGPDTNVLKWTSLSLPADNRLAGNGSYDFVNKKGQAHVEGQDWPLHLVEGIKLGFAMDASVERAPSNVDPKQDVSIVDLKQFVLRSGQTSLSVEGTYDGRRPKPVQASVTFANSPAPAVDMGQPALIKGYVLGTAQLAGTMSPPIIAINGSLTGRNAQILGHPLGDLTTQLSGSIDNGKATIRADGIPFLGGIWNLGATYVTEQEGTPVYATTVDLSVDTLPLTNVSSFLGTPPITGTFAGHWIVHFPGLNPDLAKVEINGSGNVQQFAVSYLAADQVNFTTSMKDGVLRADPVRLTRGHYGQISATAELATSRLRHVDASLQFTAFPIDIPPAALGLQIWGGSDSIGIDLPDAKSKDPDAAQLRINSTLGLRTVVSLNNQPEGEVRTTSDLKGRQVTLRQLEGNLVGGTVDGSAFTDLDHIFTRSRAVFGWKNLQIARVVRLFPALKGMGGSYSGSAVLRPATDPRPLEPLAFDLYTYPTKAHWRTVNFGGIEFHAYVGQHRVIASDLQPSLLHLGNGGSVEVWFSSSDHIDTVPLPNGQEQPSGITVSNQFNLRLHGIEIDPFISAFDPKHEPGLGRIRGQIFLLSAPQTRPLKAGGSATAPPPGSTTAPAPPQQDALQYILQSTTMDGNLEIGDTDLGGFGPVAFLYNLMHLGRDIRKPTGRGTITLRMERGNLHISSLDYFNRGIQVTGIATVSDIWKLEKAPIEGAAVGSLSPLKDIKIPLFAEVGAILTQVQGQLTGVIFKGTLEAPDGVYVKQTGLSEIGSELRGIVINEFGGGKQ